MRKIIWEKQSKEERQRLLQRPTAQTNRDTEGIVKAILDDVRREGDVALRRYTQKFDKYDPTPILIAEKQIDEAEQKIDPSLRQAIKSAYANLMIFHKRQGYQPFAVETLPGLKCERIVRSIPKVGLYIPGGTAPLLSTTLMLGVPSQLAGNGLCVLCTPCNAQGEINPAILFAAKICGIRLIARVGGAQAIAAMAFGTESVPAVDKIFGPGNVYVTQAKILAAKEPNGPAMDMPAGPSEVLVIVDASTPACFAAADLLAQAEHDTRSQVVLIAESETQIDAIRDEVSRQLELLPRKAIAQEAIKNSLAIVAASKEQAIEISNAYAPEHLILCFEGAEAYLNLVQNAGSVFCGLYTPESFGDYASGTNHVLPTEGYARAYAGLTVEAFQKTITVQQASKPGFDALTKTVVTMAEAEGLDGHARAVKIRKER
ncbi:MAG: histidinol dehydrogenase [Bdellovibrionales bacterium]